MWNLLLLYVLDIGVRTYVNRFWFKFGAKRIRREHLPNYYFRCRKIDKIIICANNNHPSVRLDLLFGAFFPKPFFSALWSLSYSLTRLLAHSFSLTHSLTRSCRSHFCLIAQIFGENKTIGLFIPKSFAFFFPHFWIAENQITQNKWDV